MSTPDRGSDQQSRGEGKRVRHAKREVGKDSWMRGKDGWEEREEPKSQLMLVQLLPKKRKKKRQNR